MRIVYMGNRQVGQDIHGFIVDQGENVVWGTVTGGRLPANDEIAILKPDIGISIMYPRILNGETLGLFPEGVINLHPSLLPYCRGKYPALWAIIEHKPAGATLHYMDKGMDTGDIIVQQWVSYNDWDTCRDIYERCIQAGYYVFEKTWDSIVHGACKRVPQPRHKATFHLAKEIEDPQKWFNMTVKEIRNEWSKP